MAVLAILGVVTSCLGPAIEIGKLIVAPIKLRCSYLCCFRSNIKTLEDEAKILDDATSDLQGKIAPATNNAEIINSQVETWLTKSNDMKNETNKISAEAPNVASGCLKLGKRYSLSKKAKETTIDIKKLVETSKFAEISHPPPAAATAPVESGTATYEFESRRKIEEGIMRSLGDKNVNKIGICGMGGLGKTTMARKIMNRALKELLFGEVAMAVVSQPVDKLNIQQQIAKPLGLEFKDDNVLDSRANRLRERLKGRNRTLVVLDDVWESLDMEELGIPREDGCKVLLTSRNNVVFKKMDVEKVCQVKILDEIEAWILFRGKAGECVDGAVLNPIARDVMGECKGLPLALATVGIALKDEKDETIWEDALRQLKKSNPSDITDVIKEVYNPLRLSYDRLGDENKNAKSIFLLCCLFPEDYEIPLAHLAYFATGLHLFEDIGELKEVRWRTSALVKKLKTRGLLLDGCNEDHVRMHDVARDVSIFIASKEGRVKCSECAWISSHVDGGARVLVPPHASSFPKLKLLFMNDKAEGQEVEINEDKLIGGSTELNVLFMEEYALLKSLPHTTQSLKISLTTLVLRKCESLESIAFVGQLESLEILICSSCHSIKELPEQLRELKRLKLLKISRCVNLERVAAGVISSLVRLEELKIVSSFRNWKGSEIEEGKEATTDACLSEIEALKKLRCLDIEVSNIALAARPFCLSSKLVQFSVRLGNSVLNLPLPKAGYRMKMFLSFGCGNVINMGDLSTNVFLSRIECLSVDGRYHVFTLNLAAAPSLRWLTLARCENRKNITSATAAFPLLEYLSLQTMPELEEIWDDDAPISSNSFNNLKKLKLYEMEALKRMGKSVLSTTKDLFLQLETIQISKCGKMEHLVMVPNEEQDKDDDHISTVLTFPKLKTLYLEYLPKLMSMICSRGIESIQFPLLADMEIMFCDNLKWLVSRDDDDDHCKDDDDSLHLFCHPKVSFGNLQKLKLGDTGSKNVWCDHVSIGLFTGLVELNILYCNNVRRLFSSSSKIPQYLVILQKLQIHQCEEMVKVIEGESSCDDHATKHTTLLFPSLQEINMQGLPKLESFCEWGCAIHLPSLKILDISNCDEMKSFDAGSLVITPALQRVVVNGRDLEYAGDLNVALHQHFEKAKAREWASGSCILDI